MRNFQETAGVPWQNYIFLEHLIFPIIYGDMDGIYIA